MPDGILLNLTPMNRFKARPSTLSSVEKLVKIILWCATYFVIACALGIFADIFVKGAPVVFQKTPPFINVPFLTELPETLVIFEPGPGESLKLKEKAFDRFRARNLKVAFTSEKADANGMVSFTVEERKALQIGQSFYRDEFLASNPDFKPISESSASYSGGGILGPIVGTVLLTTIAVVVALFIGVAAAVFLSEYSSGGPFIDTIRLAILNLAGVPSIVFGLFGLGLFCLALGWGTSMLSGGFTLAVMILPVIITASEESLKAIPKGFREASLALGATKWQTIRKAVLPYAMPGILTASVLGVTRVAGETAPIMFTAAVAAKDKLPWENLGSGGFFSQSVQSLPYHIFTVSARIPQTEYTRPMQYGSVFVFMVMVMCLSGLSVWMRTHYRGKLKW